MDINPEIRNLRAATTTNNDYRLSAHYKSPPQPLLRLTGALLRRIPCRFLSNGATERRWRHKKVPQGEAPGVLLH
jgi:hypothetical protein